MTAYELVEPAFRSVPTYTRTFGPVVADLAATAGLPPDPEQELALDALFALRPDNTAAAFEFAVICSRQNLKTALFEMCALGWLYITEQRLIIWSAHEFSTAQEAFRNLSSRIESTPVLSRRLKPNGIRAGAGTEAIELSTGQRVRFKARTKSGGRGLTGDKVVLDEAFALQASHMGALFPLLSARPDPQVVYGSSAGLAESFVLRSIRDRGRAGDDPRLAYLEWCDDLGGECQSATCSHAISEPNCLLDDRRRWKRANPAMHRRITEDYIEGERRALPPEEFARERLGWWDEPSGESAIPGTRWLARFDAEAKVDGIPVFALDVSPKLTHAAIAVAGTAGRDIHVELLGREGQEDLDYRPGTDWVLPALLDLKSRAPDLAVSIAANGQAKSLAPALEEAGIKVEKVESADVASACGLLYKLAIEGGMTHSGQIELATSVAAGKWKDTGEGAQVWGRRKSGEITGLYAATLAVWRATHRPSTHPIDNVW